MRRPAAALLACTIATPAAASGTLDCSALDANLAFTARAVISRGMGGAWSNFSAELEVKAKRFPAALARRSFERRELVHSWLAGSDIRLTLYAETQEGDAFRWTEMVVQDGRYRLTAFASDDPAGGGKPRILRGRVRCSGDTTG